MKQSIDERLYIRDHCVLRMLEHNHYKGITVVTYTNKVAEATFNVRKCDETYLLDELLGPRTSVVLNLKKVLFIGTEAHNREQFIQIAIRIDEPSENVHLAGYSQY